jgi:hypothetical protein
MDSGCAYHITYDANDLFDLITLDMPIQVLYGKGPPVTVTQAGSMCLVTLVGKKEIELEFRNVLYDTNGKVKALSMRQLTELGHQLVFSDRKVTCRLGKDVLMTGCASEEQGVYVLDAWTVQPGAQL